MAKTRADYITEKVKESWDDSTEISFDLVDHSTVARLKKDGDIKLPYKHLDKIKDKKWNTKQMSSKLLHGLLNGDSVADISKSILKIVGNNESAAIRNARTMVTGAENRGRLDSYENLSAKGVVQKKVWIATPDDRTRESHLEIDGEERDIDEEFSNELMYPGDPDGEMSEVYNCRCTMRDKIVGFIKNDGTIVRVGRERDDTIHDRQMREEKERRREKDDG